MPPVFFSPVKGFPRDLFSPYQQRLCFFGGALPKPRPVPEIKWNKDYKTLNYKSIPRDANAVLKVPIFVHRVFRSF
jgi:hypothetical protein